MNQTPLTNIDLSDYKFIHKMTLLHVRKREGEVALCIATKVCFDSVPNLNFNIEE